MGKYRDAAEVIVNKPSEIIGLEDEAKVSLEEAFKLFLGVGGDVETNSVRKNRRTSKNDAALWAVENMLTVACFQNYETSVKSEEDKTILADRLAKVWGKNFDEVEGESSVDAGARRAHKGLHKHEVTAPVDVPRSKSILSEMIIPAMNGSENMIGVPNAKGVYSENLIAGAVDEIMRAAVLSGDTEAAVIARRALLEPKKNIDKFTFNTEDIGKLLSADQLDALIKMYDATRIPPKEK